jgi:heptosyltransferase II
MWNSVWIHCVGSVMPPFPIVSARSDGSAAPPARPLIVRLRNWVGDVVLSVPALRLLAEQGHALELVGKPWAASLLAGEGWPVHRLAPRGLRQGARQMRALRQQCRTADPGFDHRINTLVMPYSFSSAVHARLAGLRALGHAYDGRSLLLARALPVPRGVHEVESLWQLAWSVQGHGPAPPVPAAIGLRIAPAAQAVAQQRLAQAGVAGPYLVLCPFAGGLNDGHDKRWPGFAALAEHLAGPGGLPLVMCPGPGEEAMAHQLHPAARVLPGLDMGEYAAVLQGAALVIANDTGPGHLAAAVGTPVITVMRAAPGNDKTAKWRPWSTTAAVVHDGQAWPAVDAVLARAAAWLAAAGAPRR